jgi:polyisoprenoid-binding protein YceI
VTKRIALILWAVCATAGVAPAEPGAPAGDYRIVSDESELRVLIFSAGALGALGHNHVISSHGLVGSVHVGASPGDSRVELSLPVESLVVDAAEARASAGPAFEGEVDEEDRRGTRENMLGDELLDVARYPEVRIVTESISGEFAHMTVQARIEIRSSPHAVDLPVSVAFSGNRLVATGRTEISHAELGLEPFSAGFGTLRVADDMVFRYRIVAERDRP